MRIYHPADVAIIKDPDGRIVGYQVDDRGEEQRHGPARRSCGCEVTPDVVWDAGAGTGSYCPTCGASLSRPAPKPPADTRWIQLKQVGGGPSVAAIYGLAWLAIALIVVLAALTW